MALIPGSGAGADQLTQYIERIERLEEEKRAMMADIRDVYAEAKATGFDPKIMRQLVKMRAMDRELLQEQDELLQTCFVSPYDDVRHSNLAHNHMALALRAFLTRAKWQIPAKPEKKIVLIFERMSGGSSVMAAARLVTGPRAMISIGSSLAARMFRMRRSALSPEGGRSFGGVGTHVVRY